MRTKDPPPRRVNPEEYERTYRERESLLDRLPGGAQGARPDMADLEVEEEAGEDPPPTGGPWNRAMSGFLRDGSAAGTPAGGARPFKSRKGDASQIFVPKRKPSA